MRVAIQVTPNADAVSEQVLLHLMAHAHRNLRPIDVHFVERAERGKLLRLNVGQVVLGDVYRVQF